MLQLCQYHSNPIFHYTIYGERHSGTNFLQQCIQNTFGLTLNSFFGSKHFFGWCKPETISYHKYARNNLFIGIVRNPYNWIHSFYSLPHHVPKENSWNIEYFITNEWYSVDNVLIEIMTDRNFNCKPSRRYKNIFEMRREKCLYLSQVMPLIAHNYILISYDLFIKNHNNYMNIIGQRFNLKKIGEPPQALHKTDGNFDQRIKNIIDSNLDWSVEESLGYFKK